MIKVIFIPGNGGGSPKDNWFPYLQENLMKLGVNVIAEEFPDNILARETYWIPFLTNELKPDEETILVGYSSGAIAAMRFAESNKLLGSVLIGAYHTDLGYANEKESGYFDRPWKWDSIIQNQEWIIQFSSVDDHCIPIHEARYVHEKLQTEYYELQNEGHFNFDKSDFPELLDVIRNKIENL